MFSSRYLIFIVTVFFFLSGVTWVAGEAGIGILGRISFADVLGLIIVLFYTVSLFVGRSSSVNIPVLYRRILPLLIVFFISAIFAEYQEKAIFEIIVHFFSIIVSLSLFNLLRHMNPIEFQGILKGLLIAFSALAIIGLLQFFIFPNWFSGAAGGLSGTFRNTGQAGAFFVIGLGIIIPALISGLIKPNFVAIMLTLLLLTALIFTFKRAGLIGLLLGFILLLIKMLLSKNSKDKKLVVLFSILIIIMIPLFLILFNWGLENIPSMKWRFESKFAENSVQTFRDGFLNENITLAMKAFDHSPYLGVGLGNIAGVISVKYEIHSTYLAILGTSGLFGLIAYSIFAFSLVKVVSVHAGFDNVYSRFLYYLQPLIIGFFISWAYTYHLRKREFWILILIISLCIYFSKKQKRLYKANKEIH